MRNLVGLVALLSLAGAGLALPGAAQPVPQGPYLELGEPVQADRLVPGTLTGEAGPVGAVAVPWRYTMAEPREGVVGAASEAIVIHWAVACDAKGLVLPANLTTEVAVAPGTAVYEGTTQVPMAATPAARSDQAPLCTLTAFAADAGPAAAKTEPVSVVHAVAVEYLGRIEVLTPAVRKVAAPQKQILFPLTVTNEGNALSGVRFHLADEPGHGWHPVAPSPVFLEPGETTLVPFVVSTPFENGPNSGDATFTLQATPFMARDEGRHGAAVELVLEGEVKGWYVPGPSPVLLLTLVGLATLAARRR